MVDTTELSIFVLTLAAKWFLAAIVEKQTNEQNIKIQTYLGLRIVWNDYAFGIPTLWSRMAQPNSGFSTSEIWLFQTELK